MYRAPAATPYTRKSGERRMTSGRFSYRLRSDPPERTRPRAPPSPADPRRALCALLRRLGSVLRPRLLAVVDTAGVQGASYDVIAHAREILHPAATHQHHRVLLQVMPLARDVRRHFHTIGKANTGDLAQCRIGLLRRHGLDLGADAALLGGIGPRPETTGIPTQRIVGEPQRGRLGLLLDALAALTNQLIDRRHELLLAGQEAFPIPCSATRLLRRHLSCEERTSRICPPCGGHKGVV